VIFSAVLLPNLMTFLYSYYKTDFSSLSDVAGPYFPINHPAHDFLIIAIEDQLTCFFKSCFSAPSVFFDGLNNVL